MTTKLRILVPLFPLLLCSLHAQPQALECDPAQTKVSFTLDSLLHTVHGEFQLKRGTLRVEPATGAVSGELVVDAASGASGNSARDHRMHSAILESARYPEIVLKPEKLEGAIPQQGKATLQLHGKFQIHGVNHDLVIPVDVEAANGGYNATLRFDIPYVQWGMKNPSTLMLRVSDKVNITVKTVVRPAGAVSTARVEKAAQ